MKTRPSTRAGSQSAPTLRRPLQACVAPGHPMEEAPAKLGRRPNPTKRFWSPMAANLGLRLLALWSRALMLASPSGNFDYKRYWEKRYKAGGSSGAGSYGAHADWKASVINRLVNQRGLVSAVEVGCGDGAQLEKYSFGSYTGVDISATAVKLCEKRFAGDNSKRFIVVTPGEHIDLERADLVICVEVLMHVIDENDFRWTLEEVFRLSKDFVVILNPLGAIRGKKSPHEKTRNLLMHLTPFFPDFSVEEVIFHPSVTLEDRINGVAGEMGSDFVVLRRRNDRS